MRRIYFDTFVKSRYYEFVFDIHAPPTINGRYFPGSIGEIRLVEILDDDYNQIPETYFSTPVLERIMQDAIKSSLDDAVAS